MAIDFPTLLQGLGASAMAFADPRQSLLMSQDIFERNRLARERRERQEQQRRQLAAEQARQAQAQANWQAEQAVREGRLGLAAQKYTDAQQLDQRERAELAAFYGGGTLGVMPPNPFDLSGNAPYTAVSGLPTVMRAAPTDTAAAIQEASLTGMPPLPQVQRASAFNTLQPSLFSPRPAPPPGFGPPGQAVPTGDAEQDAYQQWLGRYREAMRTGNKRLMDAVRAEKPPASLVKLQMGGEDLSPAEFSTWGQYKADPNKRFLYDPETGAPVLADKVHAGTGQSYQEHVQVEKTTKPPGAEETRFLSLGRSVEDKSDQLIRVLDQFDLAARGQYFGSQVPLIGQFFSDTTGGKFYSLVGALITDSLYQVSGSEAPPREIAKRFEIYAPKAWDSSETIRWKLENLRSLSQYSREYRLNEGFGEDDELSKEQMDALLLGHDAQFAQMNNVPPPPPVAPPPGFSYSGWDPQRKLHVYMNKDGKEKFAKPVQ